MANKRQLKKLIRHICADVAVECGIALEVVPNIDKDKISDALRHVAELQTGTLNKTSFNFDKARHDYANRAEYNREKQRYNHDAFRRLRVEFNESLLDIVKEMNSALPKEEKK